MNLILFGPSGIGKSTILAALKSDNVRAVDLEDVYPSRVRFQLPAQLQNVVIGGADLNPSRSYSGAKKVFLSMPEDEYAARRDRRNSLQPGKALQHKPTVDEFRKAGTYDYEVDVTGPINAVVAQIRTIMRKEGMI